MIKDTKIKGVIFNIVEKIKENYKPEKIILYGSFVYGNPDKDSDIDLLIIKDTPDRPIARCVDVRQIMTIDEDALISPLVITPREMEHRLARGDQFLQQIISKGEVLYG